MVYPYRDRYLIDGHNAEETFSSISLILVISEFIVALTAAICAAIFACYRPNDVVMIHK